MHCAIVNTDRMQISPSYYFANVMQNEDLQDWITHLKHERAFSSHSIRAYESDLMAFLSWLEEDGHALTDVRKEHLRGWLAFGARSRKSKARGRLKPATISYRVKTNLALNSHNCDSLKDP